MSQPWRIDDIKDAFDYGLGIGATHMVVMLDTFSLDNYPIFVFPGQDPRSSAYGSEDRPLECYTYQLSWEEQAEPGRVWNWDYYVPETLGRNAT